MNRFKKLILAFLVMSGIFFTNAMESHVSEEQLPPSLGKTCLSSLNMVIVMGEKGAGKSTLVHLLAGKEMYSDQNHGRWEFSCNKPLKGIDIAHGAVAVASIPGNVVNKDATKVIWDLPSLVDNNADNVCYDVNDYDRAIGLHYLLSNGMSDVKIKVVATISEDSLSLRRGHYAKQIINLISEIFPDKEQLKKCVSFVITRKTNTHPSKTLLDQLLLGGEVVSGLHAPNAYELLDSLITGKVEVIDFPIPTQEGKYEVPQDLQSLIDSTSYVLNPIVTMPTEKGCKAGRWCGDIK